MIAVESQQEVTMTHGSEKEIKDANPNYYVKTLEDLKILLNLKYISKLG